MHISYKLKTERKTKENGGMMKAFLILEDGHVFTGTSIGSQKEVISEIVFNTSMTGYLEVLTDPSYAGQAVCMTYPLIGNYGICYDDQESLRPWPDGYIVRELSRLPSNFRCQDTIQNFLKKFDIPGIAGIDTRALTKILREKGTMNGMITTNENYHLDEIIPKLKAYNTGKVVEKVTCSEKSVLKGEGFKVALLDLGAKNNIARSLNERGCEVTIYPALTTAEEILAANPDGIMLSNGPGDPKECVSIIKEIKKPVRFQCTDLCNLSWTSADGTGYRRRYPQDEIRPPRRKPPGQGPCNRKSLHFFPEPRLCRRYRYPGSECGSSGLCERQRRHQRGTQIRRQKHLYRTVPSGGMPWPAGFRIPV